MVGHPGETVPTPQNFGMLLLKKKAWYGLLHNQALSLVFFFSSFPI